MTNLSVASKRKLIVLPVLQGEHCCVVCRGNSATLERVSSDLYRAAERVQGPCGKILQLNITCV